MGPWLLNSNCPAIVLHPLAAPPGRPSVASVKTGSFKFLGCVLLTAVEIRCPANSFASSCCRRSSDVAGLAPQPPSVAAAGNWAEFSRATARACAARCGQELRGELDDSPLWQMQKEAQIYIYIYILACERCWRLMVSQAPDKNAVSESTSMPACKARARASVPSGRSERKPGHAAAARSGTEEPRKSLPAADCVPPLSTA